LPHVVSDSPAYLALDAFARAVLHEILRRFNGYNNGRIAISYEEIGARLKGRNKARPNNARITRAVLRLMEHGLIGEPEPESWLQRRAREYRLTFVTSGNAPPFRSATNDYLRWTPARAKIDGDAGSPRMASRGDRQSPRLIRTGDAGSPDNSKNGSFALPSCRVPGDGESPLIDKPYGGAVHSGSVWWTADKMMAAQMSARLSLMAWLAPQVELLSAA
jgi:hypothetical protein